MKAVTPDPARSLAIIFGASEFPRNPLWEPRHAFDRSASAVAGYLTGQSGLSIRTENVLNLFNSPDVPMVQLEAMEAFLTARLTGADTDPENLFVYYVGHGCFASDNRHSFAVHCTRRDSYGTSAVSGHELAHCIRTNAPLVRRFLILDCCFAAQLYSEFQSTPGQALQIQLQDELPEDGTALLCASSKDSAGKARDSWQYTMFGGAFLKAVATGHESFGPQMSLRQVETLCRQILKHEFPDDFVRPELHVPGVQHGDISLLPLFPNPAWSEDLVEAAEEARLKTRQQAEQEREAEAVQLAKQREDEREAREIHKRIAADAERSSAEQKLQSRKTKAVFDQWAEDQRSAKALKEEHDRLRAENERLQALQAVPKQTDPHDTPKFASRPQPEPVSWTQKIVSPVLWKRTAVGFVMVIGGMAASEAVLGMLAGPGAGDQPLTANVITAVVTTAIMALITRFLLRRLDCSPLWSILGAACFVVGFFIVAPQSKVSSGYGVLCAAAWLCVILLRQRKKLS